MSMRKGINVFTQSMNNHNIGMMRHSKSHFSYQEKDPCPAYVIEWQSEHKTKWISVFKWQKRINSQVFKE